MKVIYFAEHFDTPQTGGGLRPYQMAKRLISAVRDAAAPR